ncbi:hypothetical protein [Tropicimonas isoalkanivorans]|uniref:Uncharacterized protein n=1 Tax=Tropicimonas isoalkanivorans TaxID=441112 RepID=A0A1I1KST4_9RHOB|nr:hypothetical protein [Tropicimonas isoalkanivorans]SFC63675.1 hypothetical protein SAMN04488094_10765 [Tropicimonas isoalkanivorans]
MAKLVAILNVVAWSGFWAFGYLALTAGGDSTGQLMTAMGLAVIGAGLGVWAYLWLVRHSERTGYAKPPKRAFPEQHREPEKYEDSHGAV